MKIIIAIFSVFIAQNSLLGQSAGIAYSNTDTQKSCLAFEDSKAQNNTINLQTALSKQRVMKALHGQKSKNKQGEFEDIGMYLAIYGTLGLPIDIQGAIFKGENGTTFDRFVSSYNQLNAANIDKPLTKLNPTFYGGGGVQVGFGVLYAEVAYAGFAAKTSATFKNGSKREIEYEQHDVQAGIGLGLGNYRAGFYLYGGLDFGFGDRLTCYTVYPDGTKSFGNENRLNGVYIGTARLSLVYGIRAFIGGERVKFIFNATRMSEWNEKVKIGISDRERGTATLLTAGGLDSDGIGVNWGEYIQNQLQYSLDRKEMVLGGWNGLSLNIGIGFTLAGAQD